MMIPDTWVMSILLLGERDGIFRGPLYSSAKNPGGFFSSSGFEDLRSSQVSRPGTFDILPNLSD